MPQSHDVWEIKTPDLRLLGWFVTPIEFVCVHIESKSRLASEKARGINLYNIYRNNVRRFRDALPIDEPKIVSAEEIKNELAC